MSTQHHFILCPFGTGGDVFPLIHVGRLLKAAGHRVSVVSMDYFAPAVERAGFTYHSFGTREEYDQIAANPDLWKPIKGTQLVFDIAAAALPGICDCIRRAMDGSELQHTTLLAPGHNFAARLMREATGVRTLTVHLQPIALLSAHDFPVLSLSLGWMRSLPLAVRKLLMQMPNLLDLMLRRRLRPQAKVLGVALPPRPTRDWWHSPDGNLVLFPASFAGPQPDWPRNTFQYGFPMEDLARDQPLEAGMAEFLPAGPKPVLFTAGTGNRHAAEFFRQAQTAVQRLGLRAIFATSHQPDVPPDLPATIHATNYVPFSQVLPQCAALIHHGGIGTLSQALAAGIPQLIVALAHDQPDNGLRIRELKIGDVMPRSRCTADSLAAALTKLLAEADQAKLQQIAADLAQPKNNDALLAWLLVGELHLHH
jgi:UDP:flavonoid glycosyltransferase YjiC (YdhE family)